MRWKPRSELDPRVIENELKQLERLDVPLLYLEAILVYVPERVDAPVIQKRFRRLSEVGILTERALRLWLERRLPPKAKSMLEDQIESVRSRPKPGLQPSGRVCCPVVIDYRSPLLPPDETLSGVRWVEVVSRGPEAPGITGFPDQGWPRRLEELGGIVRALLGTRSSESRPHWQLLDSLGRSAAEPRELARVSTSLELGAALAYAQWMLNVESNVVFGATGQIVDERGSLTSIDEPLAKMRGVAREAAGVEVMLATPRDADEFIVAGVTGIAVLPVHSLSEAIEWLRRRTANAARSSTPIRLLDRDPRSVARAINASGVGISAVTEARLQEFDELISQYESKEQWNLVVRTLLKQVDVLHDRDFRISIYRRLAAVYEHHLLEDAAAIATHQTIFSLDPCDLLSIEFLLRVYVKTDEQDHIVQMLEEIFSRTSDGSDIKFLLEIVRLITDKVRFPEVVFGYWEAVRYRAQHVGNREIELEAVRRLSAYYDKLAQAAQSSGAIWIADRFMSLRLSIEIDAEVLCDIIERIHKNASLSGLSLFVGDCWQEANSAWKMMFARQGAGVNASFKRFIRYVLSNSRNCAELLLELNQQYFAMAPSVLDEALVDTMASSSIHDDAKAELAAVGAASQLEIGEWSRCTDWLGTSILFSKAVPFSPDDRFKIRVQLSGATMVLGKLSDMLTIEEGRGTYRYICATIQEYISSLPVLAAKHYLSVFNAGRIERSVLFDVQRVIAVALGRPQSERRAEPATIDSFEGVLNIQVPSSFLNDFFKVILKILKTEQEVAARVEFLEILKDVIRAAESLRYSIYELIVIVRDALATSELSDLHADFHKLLGTLETQHASVAFQVVVSSLSERPRDPYLLAEGKRLAEILGIGSEIEPSLKQFLHDWSRWYKTELVHDSVCFNLAATLELLVMCGGRKNIIMQILRESLEFQAAATSREAHLRFAELFEFSLEEYNAAEYRYSLYLHTHPNDQHFLIARERVRNKRTASSGRFKELVKTVLAHRRNRSTR